MEASPEGVALSLDKRRGDDITDPGRARDAHCSGAVYPQLVSEIGPMVELTVARVEETRECWHEALLVFGIIVEEVLAEDVIAIMVADVRFSQWLVKNRSDTPHCINLSPVHRIRPSSNEDKAPAAFYPCFL